MTFEWKLQSTLIQLFLWPLFLHDYYYYYALYYCFKLCKRVQHQSTENMVERDFSPSCLTQYYLCYRVLRTSSLHCSFRFKKN